MIDELCASWPPGDPAVTSDHVRPSLAGTRLLDACALPSAVVGRHAVAVASGPDERLCLVLLVRSGEAWHLARAGDGASESLVAALAKMEPLGTNFQLHPLGRPPEARGERAMGVDQTNDSVVVGEAVVVKWLLRPPAVHPAPAILAHLAALGYPNVPRPLGTLTWTAPDGAEVLLALADGYLLGARDGWDWCVAAVLEHLGHLADGCAGGCAADLAAELGALTAGLHLALATPSAVLPVAVTRAVASDVVRWRSAAELTMREAGTLTEGSDGEEVRARLPRMMAALTALSDVVGTPVQRVHGDLHVGQVLRWREGLAVIDFDGNPAADPATAALPQPAARDVAGMLRSLDHVGRIVDEQTGRLNHAEVERWIARSRHRFLSAYRSMLADAGRADLLDERLMPAFEVEQECRELVYAARFLPRWRYAPIAALRSMLPP
ncbi:MAG TPA: aminoglycoside phosphotransferase [Thermoleophilia bacterium]|nr:aminoglycoside phosphotransferase [Thermoleophilia bacterium]